MCSLYVCVACVFRGGGTYIKATDTCMFLTTYFD